MPMFTMGGALVFATFLALHILLILSRRSEKNMLIVPARWRVAFVADVDPSIEGYSMHDLIHFAVDNCVPPSINGHSIAVMRLESSPNDAT